ncbi:MAG TPA: CRTAC1 family protein, partial [Armatimonadota bacterium]|nr:CRTAC1 family protein [Armatimonadota bacterium]
RPLKEGLLQLQPLQILGGKLLALLPGGLRELRLVEAAVGFGDLLQGAPLPGRGPDPSLHTALFHNEGGGRFAEVTRGSGLVFNGFAMGCCAADIDNDGDPDVFISGFGRSALFRNDGGGRFTDITRKAGVEDPGWGASAAFADYDRDGLVDLFVSRYVEYDPATAPGCRSPSGGPGYCPPEVYPATPDRLYRNRGDGVFEDVTRRAGISAEKTRGLGVLWTDFDQDGYPDIFVACDQSPNVLWHNRRNGTFENVGSALGVALDDQGRIQNGMGVDFADPDHDGDQDGVVANFSGQANSYYENDRGHGFFYHSASSGLGAPSVRMLGFGCNFLDYDGDGWEDLFVANGHVNDHISEAVPDLTYAQPASLYRNLGGGRFTEVKGPAGQSLWRERVSRGSAVADYDGDGAPDLLVTNSNDQVELFHNEARPGARWLTVRLQGTKSNRSGIGARIRLTAGGTRQTREVRAGSSYLCQSDLAQTFGLGSAERVDALEVRWPSGKVTTLRNVAGGRVLNIRE